ncbi:MAG: rRNA small subunit methyltransferase B [Ruaniaceae bacterium]|nr:rRNA small subunit methyltransferase B [Ruaniaceae bacterium]
MSNDPRQVAYNVLTSVELDGAYANLLLQKAVYPLNKRDAGFVTELVYGTLRLQGRYDAMIDECATNVDRLQPEVRIALRLGAHQICAMRVPSRAAVYETVDLVGRMVGRSPTGLVNAVLRKIAGEADWYNRILDRPEGYYEWYSHPEWVVRGFREALALEGAADKIEALLEKDNEAAELTLVARPGVAERPADAEPTPLSPFGYYWHGNPGKLREVRDGRVAAQDEGSQLVALMAADVPVEGRDEQWLDLCAGPGGKAALLAALARQRGAFLTANEIQPHRADLVAKSVRQFEDVVEVICDDGRLVGESAPGAFDRILIDAPCTGLGSLRRRPEARWRRTESDLTNLTRLQAELIDSAVAALRPGGVLTYVTCSPHPAETVEQVAGALERHSLSIVAPVAPLIALCAPHPLPGAVQLWPYRDNTDAMFAVALRREK